MVRRFTGGKPSRLYLSQSFLNYHTRRHVHRVGCRYALMEMALDVPDLPVGMLSDVHLKRCERFLSAFSILDDFNFMDCTLDQYQMLQVKMFFWNS